MTDLRCYQPDQPVSVVIVCRNKAETMGKVVEKIATNIRRPDLVVLSDDNSDDGSPELFEQCCRRHGLNYRVILHPDNGMSFRLNTMRNDGIQACPDGLVVILDADLVPARTCFDAHCRMHLEHPGSVVVSTGPRLEYAYPDATGPINFLWGWEMVGLVSLPSMGKHPAFPVWQITPGSMMAMTREAIREAGWFDTQYDGNYGYDDQDFMVRVDRMGAIFVGDWEAHVIHIPHPPSLGHRDNEPNRQKFISKYGFDKVYPDIVPNLCRRPWNEYYQDLMENRANMALIRTLPLDFNSGMRLLRSLIQKIGKKQKAKSNS